MARTMISVCSHCGARFEESADSWFVNADFEWLHYCPDARIGQPVYRSLGDRPSLRSGRSDMTTGVST